MYSGGSTRALPRVSFLIRRSRDQRSVSTSPGLIAAAHVLHRLLAPRHPPCALVLLIRKEHVNVVMEFSRCARVPRTSPCRSTAHPRRRAARGTGDEPVLQSSTACGLPGRRPSRGTEIETTRETRVDVVLGGLCHRTSPGMSRGHRRAEQPPE